MIRLFGQTDTVFTSNGDVVIHPIKARVTNKDNGDYYLQLETDLSYVDYLTEGRIVVANTPSGDQAFRVGNVQKTGKKITTKCYHVFYDSKNYLIPYANIEQGNALTALQTLNGATVPMTEFIVSSDIADLNDYECTRKSLNEAVKDVLSIWGGHLVRNNFYIGISESVGEDKGIIVQYKKNLKDITVQEDWKSVATKILPTGKDGIMLNAVDPSADIYMESDVQYALPYVKAVSFSQKIDQNDYPSETEYKRALVADLHDQAEKYLEENKLPKVNYTLKANLSRVTDIGDTIMVYDERLGVELLTNVIGFEYDCISERYTQVQFGNFLPSLNGFASSLMASAVAEASAEAETQMNEMMTASYVIYDGTKILVVDRLPKEDAQDEILIDHNGIKFTNQGSQTAKFGIDGSFYIGTDELTDFIKETGTTNGWKWVKYASGACEAWKTATETPTYSSLVTGLYKGAFDVSYPFNITGAVVEATMESTSGTGWVAMASSGIDKTTVTVVKSANSGSATVNVHVRGSI